MDNQFILTTDNKSNIDAILSEKKRTEALRLNMVCRNEQLKILIDKLNILANQKENKLISIPDFRKSSGEYDQIYRCNSLILDELKNAIDDSKNLERAITKLKMKMVKLDEKLAN